MAMTVHCDIVSAEGEIFSGLVEMVIAHGNLGDLGIAPGHAPLITNLKPGPITLTKQGGAQEVFYISGGFLEVQPNMVKVLADTVQRAADLDEAQAQEDLKAAENALNAKARSSTTAPLPHVWPKPQLSCGTVQQLAQGKVIRPTG